MIKELRQWWQDAPPSTETDRLLDIVAWLAVLCFMALLFFIEAAQKLGEAITLPRLK